MIWRARYIATWRAMEGAGRRLRWRISSTVVSNAWAHTAMMLSGVCGKEKDWEMGASWRTAVWGVMGALVSFE